MADAPGAARRAVEARRSHSTVGEAAPSDEQLRPLIAAASSVADHGALRPWRVIALRGESRARLGTALAEAAGLDKNTIKKLFGELYKIKHVLFPPDHDFTTMIK